MLVFIAQKSCILSIGTLYVFELDMLIGIVFSSMLFMFFTVPSYSAVKSSYALGLLPCFVVLITSAIGVIPRSRISGAIVSGYMFSWLAFAYIAYFAW